MELAAQHHGWSEVVTAVQLALALEEKALQVLLDLHSSDRQEYRALAKVLERRFGERKSEVYSREWLISCRHREENIGTFAADIHYHARMGYPTFPPSSKDELALHAFLRTLAPEELARHVRLAAPVSLEEAIELDPNLIRTEQAPARHPHDRMAVYEDGE